MAANSSGWDLDDNTRWFLGYIAFIILGVISIGLLYGLASDLL